MNHRQQPDPRAQKGNDRSPTLEGYLTLKKQAQTQATAARNAVVAAQNALEAADAAQRDVSAIWQEYREAYSMWQTAQQSNAAVKAGETRISELRYRILLAGALVVGLLVLAAIQVTSSSMLVVVLLGVVPCLIYISAKVRRLRVAQNALPKNGVGDPASLWKASEKLRQRFEKANAHAQRQIAQRPVLLSRYQLALKDLADWEFKVRDAEIKIRAQISVDRARKHQQGRNS
jgi:hypothetical protein